MLVSFNHEVVMKYSYECYILKCEEETVKTVPDKLKELINFNNRIRSKHSFRLSVKY